MEAVFYLNQTIELFAVTDNCFARGKIEPEHVNRSACLNRFVNDENNSLHKQHISSRFIEELERKKVSHSSCFVCHWTNIIDLWSRNYTV